jgi:hypothetical protein
LETKENEKVVQRLWSDADCGDDWTLIERA